MRLSVADHVAAPLGSPRGRSRGRRRLAVPLLASLALAGGLMLVAETAPRSAPQIADVAGAGTGAAAPPAWVEINRPIPIFDIEAPELAKLARAYDARRHQTGGGRQDVLTFGTPDDPAYLRLTIYRMGSEAAPAAPFFVDIARRAADAGLGIGKSLPPQTLPTRFGNFEVAELTLVRDAAAHPGCLGFRASASDARIEVSGLACGTPAKTQQALGCLLEHLDLSAAAGDKTLVTFFAGAELHRNPACLGGRLVPTPVHASWLDSPPDPQPKTKPKRPALRH